MTKEQDGKAMKKERDGMHPSSHYLVVENPETVTTWHLRVKDVSGKLDHRLMGAAWAALHEGFQGNKYEGPNKQEALAKLKKLYEQEDMPLPGGGKTVNALKAVEMTDTELIAANYIILFGDEVNRDLEGIASPRKNADGTTGEFFTKATELDSPYLATGQLLIDWEHGFEPDGDVVQPGEDDVLGFVRWKSARVDDRGVWVERVLNRHNEYMKFLEVLIDQGIIGTSSLAVSDGVKTASNGEITHWPLKRDTLTVMPMEWRQKWNNENVLQAVKGLADLDAAFKSLLPESDEPAEQEPSEGDAGASREVELKAKAGRAQAEQLLIQIESMRR